MDGFDLFHFSLEAEECGGVAELMKEEDGCDGGDEKANVTKSRERKEETGRGGDNCRILAEKTAEGGDYSGRRWR